jgi:hypothetical protein
MDYPKFDLSIKAKILRKDVYMNCKLVNMAQLYE